MKSAVTHGTVPAMPLHLRRVPPPITDAVRELLEASPEPAILLAANHEILAANSAYRARYGDVGQTCYSASHDLDSPCGESNGPCPLRATIESGRRQRVFHIQHGAAGPRYVDIEMEPILDSNGRVAYFLERVHENRDPRIADGVALVGRAPSFLKALGLLQRAAPSDVPVLILGESGTGKELAARAIHQMSPRRQKPFMPVECSGLPETLFESELFGYEQGAFTGAQKSKRGLVDATAGGTLFLDEIGDLDAGLQTRLLRVLQERQWERVGGVDTLTLRARVMAATHRPVRPGSAGVTLREDLYYRLAVIEVDLPPLRARRSDVPLLVAHALRGTRARAVSESAMRELQDHHWPGNVRELLHTVTRAAVMCSGEVIDTPDLPDNLTLPQNPESSRSQSADPYAGMTLKSAVAALEKSMIVSALARSNGNRTEAARILGIARPQLYAKLDEHGLSTRRE